MFKQLIGTQMGDFFFVWLDSCNSELYCLGWYLTKKGIPNKQILDWNFGIVSIIEKKYFYIDVIHRDYTCAIILAVIWCYNEFTIA